MNHNTETMLSPDFKLFDDRSQITRDMPQSDQSRPERMPIVKSSTSNAKKASDLLIGSAGVEKENTINQSKKKEAKTNNKEQSIKVKKRKHVSNPTTPSRQPSKVVGIMSSLKKKGGKIVRNLTPPRHLHIGIQTPHRQRQPTLRMQKSDLNKSIEKSRKDLLSSPKALTLSPRFETANEYTIRSSETDPSPFQLDIPSHESVLAHCKICCILENYFEIGGLDFDFSSLMPWVGGTNNSKPKYPYNMKNNAPHVTKNEEENKIKRVHEALQGIVDDIIVEGFFRDFYVDDNGENGLARIETCVFSSSKLRRFIVCYRCSSDLQDRPLHGIQSKRKISRGKSNDSRKPNQNNKDIVNLINNSSESLRRKQEESLVFDDVNEAYLKVFQNEKLQGNLNTLLNRLTSLKPFYDVAMTGHSFSGGIATLSSFSFALNHPATRVYCHVFGSPIVGGSYFRDQVHSLPNLNLIRVERSTDPFVNLPEVSSNNINFTSSFDIKGKNNNMYNNQTDEWIHSGHCLCLTPTCAMTISDETKRPVDLKLYRFDKLRPASNFMKASLRSVSNLKKLKIGNEINSYKKDLEKVDKLDLQWVNCFHGLSEKVLSSNGVFA